MLDFSALPSPPDTSSPVYQFPSPLSIPDVDVAAATTLNVSPINIRAGDSRNKKSRTDSGSPSSSCQCEQIAIEILEAIEVKANTNSPCTSAQILQIQKQALRQCTTMLACIPCSNDSRFVMLLAVIFEKMTHSFQRLLTRTDLQCFLVGGSSEPSLPTQGDHTLYLADYEIDDNQERQAVVHALITLQLKALNELLSRLEGIATAQNWGTHCMMIAAASKDLQEVSHALNRITRASTI